jgi:hypothetical protein
VRFIYLYSGLGRSHIRLFGLSGMFLQLVGFRISLSEANYGGKIFPEYDLASILYPEKNIMPYCSPTACLKDPDSSFISSCSLM